MPGMVGEVCPYMRCGVGQVEKWNTNLVPRRVYSKHVKVAFFPQCHSQSHQSLCLHAQWQFWRVNRTSYSLSSHLDVGAALSWGVSSARVSSMDTERCHGFRINRMTWINLSRVQNPTATSHVIARNLEMSESTGCRVHSDHVVVLAW